ncbi:MAG: HDOD domain-containing protein [Gammaproteobacteria bacterium]
MGVAAEKFQISRTKKTASSAPSDQIKFLTKLIQDKPLPIFEQTLEKLKKFDNRSSPSIPRIVEILRLDPCYAHKIFVSANTGLAKSGRAPAATLNHAILVLGIPYVLNLGKELPLVSDQKDTVIKARFHQILSRSYHAGIQAKAWMIEYSKSSTETAFITAQMSHLYLASLWFYAPDKMSELIKSNSQNTLLPEVGKSLAKQWHFSDFLQESLDQSTDAIRLVNVVRFANSVASLSENGWYSKPIEDLFSHSSSILDLPEDVLIKLTHRNAVIAARETTFYPVKPTACRLLNTERDEIKKVAKKTTTVPKKKTVSKFQTKLKKLSLPGENKASAHDILDLSFELVSEISGKNPIVFFLLDRNKSVLKSRYSANFSKQKKSILISLDKNNIYKSLIKKPGSIYINSENRKKYDSLLPENLAVDIRNHDFIAFSLFVHEKPIGIFYFEGSNSSPITTQIHKQFILVCKTTKVAFEEVNTNAKNTN